MKLDEAKHILVTGGGGFLGGAIVKRLVEKGCPVTSFSRNLYPKLSKLGVRQIQGDIRQKNAVEDAFKEIDLVFHVAAQTGIWGSYETYYQTNVIGTEHVIAACRKHGIEGLVYTSSPSVVFDGTDMEGVDESVPYPDHYLAPYPATKAMAEKKVLAAAKEGVNTIVLRPHLIWGPEDTALVPRIIARAKRLKKIGDGSNLVDTVYIDNASEAHILAAEKLIENPGLSGKIYFISQGEPIPLWDMVNHILNAAGLPPVRRSIPTRLAVRIGAVMEGIYKTFGIEREPQMTRFLAEELATAHWFDISAARKDLGYEPKVSIKEGLERLQEWLRSNPSS